MPSPWHVRFSVIKAPSLPLTVTPYWLAKQINHAIINTATIAVNIAAIWNNLHTIKFLYN